jgi:hypothetical protein
MDTHLTDVEEQTGHRATTILDLRGILYRYDQGCLSREDRTRPRDYLAFPADAAAMAGTTVEGPQACGGAADGTAVRLELFIDTAVRMAALGGDTLIIPCA